METRSIIWKFRHELLICLFITIFYSPIFGHTFGYLNDYLVFTYDTGRCCVGFPDTEQLLGIGRPLQALILNIQLMIAHSMGMLQSLRLISVVAIIILSIMIYRHLTLKFNIKPHSAAVFSILQVTL